MRNHPSPQGRAWTTEVECQTPARSTSPNSCSTGPALWEFFRKSAVRQGKRKALSYRGKGGQNTDIVFLALRLGVVLYLPILEGCRGCKIHPEFRNTTLRELFWEHFRVGVYGIPKGPNLGKNITLAWIFSISLEHFKLSPEMLNLDLPWSEAAKGTLCSRQPLWLFV